MSGWLPGCLLRSHCGICLLHTKSTGIDGSRQDQVLVRISDRNEICSPFTWLQIKEIPITFVDRVEGESKISGGM